MYNEQKIRKSEALQLILLDNLYAQSGSQHIIFQGGTALRWVYGGMRFSEDLDFVTSLKIRALYERQYIKGRDIYDVWWLTKKLRISPQWSITQNKFEMYQAPFVTAREADFFQRKKNLSNLTAAIESDLTRFIPQNIYALHREGNFGEFINTLKEVTSGLLNQGMRSFLKDHEGRKSNT